VNLFRIETPFLLGNLLLFEPFLFIACTCIPQMGYTGFQPFFPNAVVPPPFWSPIIPPLSNNLLIYNITIYPSHEHFFPMVKWVPLALVLMSFLCSILTPLFVSPYSDFLFKWSFAVLKVKSDPPPPVRLPSLTPYSFFSYEKAPPSFD